MWPRPRGRRAPLSGAAPGVCVWSIPATAAPATTRPVCACWRRSWAWRRWSSPRRQQRHIWRPPFHIAGSSRQMLRDQGNPALIAVLPKECHALLQEGPCLAPVPLVCRKDAKLVEHPGTEPAVAQRAADLQGLVQVLPRQPVLATAAGKFAQVAEGCGDGARVA